MFVEKNKARGFLAALLALCFVTLFSASLSIQSNIAYLASESIEYVAESAEEIAGVGIASASLLIAFLFILAKHAQKASSFSHISIASVFPRASHRAKLSRQVALSHPIRGPSL